MNFFSYFFSEKMALMMYRAQPVTPAENAHVYAVSTRWFRNYATGWTLPIPRLWIIPDHSPNAFATGRNPSHSSVAFTAGTLELMNDREVEGVLAHEFGSYQKSRYSDKLDRGYDRGSDHVCRADGDVHGAAA